MVDRRLGVQWDNKRDMGQAGASSGQRGYMLRYIPKSFPSRTLWQLPCVTYLLLDM